MRAPRLPRSLRSAFLLCLLGLHAVAHAVDWPTPAWPEGAKTELVATDTVLNSRHSRIWQARLPVSLAEAERFFKAQWGDKVTRNTVRGQLVLGSRQGDFFLTVQMKEQLGQVNAQLISTALNERPSRSRALQDTISWLPSEVGVLQTMESNDDARRGLTITAVGPASVDQLAEAIGLQLRRRGWTPQRGVLDTSNGLKAQQISVQAGGEDILIAISDLGERRSIVIQRNKERQP